MKVTGIDGREYNWVLRGHSVRPGDERPRSKYHRRARALLGRLFPLDSVLEEVFLPGLPQAAYCDFYLPLRRLMVEVQGEQHAEFVEHFHGDRLGFLRACGRDGDKRAWCGINGVTLAELPCGEDDDGWARRILDC